MDAVRGVDQVPAADAAGTAETCPVCLDAPAGFVVGECGHAMCVTCAVSYMCASLGDACAAALSRGVRCPQHSAGCEGFVEPADARRLLTARVAAKLASFEAVGAVIILIIRLQVRFAWAPCALHRGGGECV